MKSIEIFHSERNDLKERLTVNEDGTVTHHTEKSAWQMIRCGPGAGDITVPLSEAARHWPSYAEQIAKAYASLKA
jgi:hypothetical protein